MKKTYLLGIFLMLVTRTIYSFDTINSSAESNYDEFNTIYFTETGVSGSNIKSFEIDETDKYKMTVVFIDDTEYLIQLSNDKEFDVQGGFDKTTRLYISKLTGTSCDRKKWSNYKITLSDVEENDIVKHRYHFYNTECNRGSRNIGSKESREVISKTGNPKWLYDSGPLYFYGYNNSTSNVKPFNISSIELERIGNVNIPDANFKNALLNHNPVIDINGDGEIQLSEAQNFDGEINVVEKSIDDLTGIESFTNITSLRARENQLRLIDVSKNLELQTLTCGDNFLTDLDVTKNDKLTFIGCRNNQLKVLDVTKNSNLTALNLENNQLVNLDLSTNRALTNLRCFNNALESLDVSNGNNSNFKLFNITNNPNLNCVKVDDLDIVGSWPKQQTEFTPLDDQSYFRFDWDDNVIFSEDCSNNTPIANNDTLILYQNETETLDVLANDTDEDGDTLTLVSASATHGTVSVVNGEISYTANAEDIEEDTVTYEVSDGTETVSGTLTVVYLSSSNIGNDYNFAYNNTNGIYNANTHPNVKAYAFLRNDGTVITSGDSESGGDSSLVRDDLIDIKAIYSNSLSFAALKKDGTLITWGKSEYGGDSSSFSSELKNVKKIYSTLRAYTIIRTDGSVFSWGDNDFGGDNSHLQNDLNNNVKSISSTWSAFAALKNDGSVITWGNSDYGGDSASVNGQLVNVSKIFSNSSAFAALKSDGSVVTWGHQGHGGDSSSKQSKLNNVKDIFSTSNAFAALKDDNSVVSWGRFSNLDDVYHKEPNNVIKVYSNMNAFAVLKSDGKVEAWGGSTSGGDDRSVRSQLTDVKNITSNSSVFAALKLDGSVVVWGSRTYGGVISSDVQSKLIDIDKIFSNRASFAAVKKDGTVVTWGTGTNNGSDSSSVSESLINIKHIYSNSNSFAALKYNGNVVTWGKSLEGGDSSLVQDQLTNVVSVNMGVDYELNPTITNYVYNGTWSPSSPFGVSTTNDTITIQSGAVSFDQDVTADTVTVNSGASLSTAASTTLTANTITLESSQNSFANFLNEGTVNAEVTYKRYVADEVTLDLIASPVSGQTFSDFASNNSNLFYQEGNASRKLFGHYDNTNRKYITYYDNDTRTIDLGTGYRAARLSSAEGNTLNFTGSVSNAQIDVPINTNGDAWNLIGNPYPTSISLLAFLTDNNSKTHEEYSGVYGYNGKSADKWDIWNLSYWLSNQSAVIAPAQGFFVKSKNASDNIVFKPSMRTTTAASNFNVNKTTTTNNGWFTLELTDGITTVSTKVYLIEGTTSGLDVGYDAATFKAPNNDLAIYTSLADGSSNNTFAVQSVGLDNLNTLSIPVGLNISHGKQIQVRITDVQLPEGVEVYFNDATKVSSTLLNKGDYNYTTSTDLEGTGRFSITFSSDALSNDNQTLEGLQVYCQDQQIALQGYLESNTHITLYDLQGRAVSVKATPKASQFNSINASHLPNGVYVLEVQNTKGRFTQKLILN